jgi:hypothetical protein
MRADRIVTLPATESQLGAERGLTRAEVEQLGNGELPLTVAASLPPKATMAAW